MITRRSAMAGSASLALTSPAWAKKQDDPLKMRGYRAWTRPSQTPAKAPVDTLVDTGEMQISLGEWLGGRPAVISLWATWCTPCLLEKDKQAAMSQRLVNANARLRFLALQAFDNVSLTDARRLLKRLKADTLENACASPEAEKAFVKIFGKSPVQPTRTSMPSLLLVDADGVELGRALGMMAAANGKTDYWEDEATFEFLSKL